MNANEKNQRSKIEQWKIFLYGALGAIAPDIVNLYSKRWTTPHLTFSLTQYVVVTLIYMLLAGVLATVVPKERTPQSALAVGLSTPVVIGLLGRAGRNLVEPVRGAGETGSLLDLLIFL